MLGFMPHSLEKYSPIVKNAADINSQTAAGTKSKMSIIKTALKFAKKFAYSRDFYRNPRSL